MIITEFISIFVEILLYFLVSLICLFIGRKVYDWITPYDLNYQTAEVDNPAVGISQASFYLAIGVIVHASVSGQVNYNYSLSLMPKTRRGLWF